jgi:hypothetical protein
VASEQNEGILTEELDAASRYRQRAKELRTLANHKDSRGIEHQLLMLAENYDRMAVSAEGIDKTNQALGRVANSS